jgi:hypothetical protein
MQLAGVTVADAEVLPLAKRLVAAGLTNTADTLTVAYTADTEIVGLTCEERDDILGVLDDPPDSLCQLRAVLLQEHRWRQREGLL